MVSHKQKEHNLKDVLEDPSWMPITLRDSRSGGASLGRGKNLKQLVERDLEKERRNKTKSPQ